MKFTNLYSEVSEEEVFLNKESSLSQEKLSFSSEKTENKFKDKNIKIRT